MNYYDHTSYKLSYYFSNEIWKIVRNWSFFDQDTIGKQLVRATDSISSNIAEGWHRYYKKDKILFYNYARSSFYESIDFVNKGISRGLIKKSDLEKINQCFTELPKAINGLIKSTKENLIK